MMTLAEAALSLVGTPFRLHGRDPSTGLDCVGVLHASLARIDRQPRLPNGYTLRSRALPKTDDWADLCGLRPADRPFISSDVLLMRLSAIQHHLVIAVSATHFVHADAGLRRVVTSHAPAGWAVAKQWRLHFTE